MKKLSKYIWLLGTFCLLTSCKKFMQEQSQDLAYADTWQKLEEIMQGDVYMAHSTAIQRSGDSFTQIPKVMYFPWLNAMDDDITEFVTGDGSGSRDDVFGFYTWQANPNVNVAYIPQDDSDWPKVYKSINAANIVIAQTDKLHDDRQQLQRIKGEALFLRANYYFYLVNCYAQAYNRKTAASDLGVPLKITEYVEDKFWARATVNEVYQQMINDLNAAEKCLQDVPVTTIYHTNINAVNLLQSRIYLYMQSWELAMQAADKVIARKPVLFNLNEYKSGTSFFSATSPEAIFTEGGNAMVYLMGDRQNKSFTPSSNLMDLYATSDLRRGAFFETDSRGKLRYTKMYRSIDNNVYPTEIFSDNYFLRNAEAYLNKSEAAAMLGNVSEANAALNTLRQARFDPANFTEVSLSGKPLVDFIRDERRRELCFEGHRWFDLKRYAVNETYPFTKTILHPYSYIDYNTPPILKATQRLLPGDPAYLIPIPSSAIVFNQGTLIQNPDRPNRAF